jgi:Leucine-rich repeat (LRR) protein
MNPENIFEIVIGDNDELTQKTISSLTKNEHNKSVNSYLINLAFFHRDSKVKKVAKDKLKEFGMTELLSQVKAHWKPSYLKGQEYYRKELYQNELTDSCEYLVVAQATRRNYFLKNAKPFLLSHIAMRYGDEVENIFDCYQVQIEKISRSILKLPHITVANFRGQHKLDFSTTIEILSLLPNLNFLQFADSSLNKIPGNISKIKNLRTLILEINPIDSLDNIKLPLVEKLDIRRTKIRFIDMEQFPNLKELWIDDKRTLDEINFKNKRGSVRATSGKSFSEII